MIKTFISEDEVIISEEALKARYPEYIAYIDCKACCEDGIILRALQETQLIDAIRKVEDIANKNINKVYLCGIFQKTDNVTKLNEPLYEIVVGARMGKHKLNDWHLWNEENGETTFPFATWYSDDFMKDDVEVWSSKGELKFYNPIRSLINNLKYGGYEK